jgi:hypothetical protein
LIKDIVIIIRIPIMIIKTHGIHTKIINILGTTITRTTKTTMEDGTHGDIFIILILRFVFYL